MSLLTQLKTQLGEKEAELEALRRKRQAIGFQMKAVVRKRDRAHDILTERLSVSARNKQQAKTKQEKAKQLTAIIREHAVVLERQYFFLQERDRQLRANFQAISDECSRKQAQIRRLYTGPAAAKIRDVLIALLLVRAEREMAALRREKQALEASNRELNRERENLKEKNIACNKLKEEVLVLTKPVPGLEQAYQAVASIEQEYQGLDCAQKALALEETKINAELAVLLACVKQAQSHVDARGKTRKKQQAEKKVSQVEIVSESQVQSTLPETSQLQVMTPKAGPHGQKRLSDKPTGHYTSPEKVAKQLKEEAKIPQRKQTNVTSIHLLEAHTQRKTQWGGYAAQSADLAITGDDDELSLQFNQTAEIGINVFNKKTETNLGAASATVNLLRAAHTANAGVGIVPTANNKRRGPTLYARLGVSAAAEVATAGISWSSPTVTFPNLALKIALSAEIGLGAKFLADVGAELNGQRASVVGRAAARLGIGIGTSFKIDVTLAPKEAAAAERLEPTWVLTPDKQRVLSSLEERFQAAQCMPDAVTKTRAMLQLQCELIGLASSVAPEIQQLLCRRQLAPRL